tara:strand:- start:252 stop:776 length:525 start_codon:yes stop_codon:yes gene_type:complete
MPGAYLKGNSLFPGASFVVDEISRPWNNEGVVQASFINMDDFKPESFCKLKYYRLKNIISLYIEALLIPNSLPYTGVENDTAYIYTGSFDFDDVNTAARFKLDSRLSCAPFHYQTSLYAEDFKTGVFFELGRSYIMGFVHMNGLIDSTELTLTVPSGFLPNHEYRISGTFIYET